MKLPPFFSWKSHAIINLTPQSIKPGLSLFKDHYPASPSKLKAHLCLWMQSSDLQWKQEQLHQGRRHPAGTPRTECPQSWEDLVLREDLFNCLTGEHPHFHCCQCWQTEEGIPAQRSYSVTRAAVSITAPEVENPGFTSPHSRSTQGFPSGQILIDLKVNKCRGAIKPHPEANGSCELWSPDSHSAKVLRCFLQTLQFQSDVSHQQEGSMDVPTLKIPVYSKSPLGNVPRIQTASIQAGAMETGISGSSAKEVVQAFCHVAYWVICR